MDFPSRSEVNDAVRAAVRAFWSSRRSQAERQGSAGQTDQGNRGAVTGGKHMDGFLSLMAKLAQHAGAETHQLHTSKHGCLPGYFRPEKEWDFVVIHQERLIAAVEVKSQVGSFGNNFNNRAEEALGNAVDLRTAVRERAYGETAIPWVGYVMLLEDSPKSRKPVGASQPHFPVFEEFKDASYADRYRILCARLVLEKLYDGASILLSGQEDAASGDYTELDPDLGFYRFAMRLMGHVAAEIQAA